MSVSISAIPIILIGSLVGEIIQRAGHDIYLGGSSTIHVEKNFEENLYRQKFQTQIVDKDTLIKTLIEHGATNIEEFGQNIQCDCERFHIEFTKINDNPYTMKITANNDVGVDNLVKDLSDEYTANAQEISYNKIKERIAEKNLEIENEEILEDNTIVLTVNLD